jgi:ribosome-binding factor A
VGWNADSKLAERIRERVAQIVLFELQDPRIAFTTITRVKLARDLSRCEVFYSVLGSEGDKSKTKHALDEARGFIQHTLGKVLRTRTVPHLVFQYDDSIDGSMRVDHLLKDLDAERRARGELPESEAPEATPEPTEEKAAPHESEPDEEK